MSPELGLIRQYFFGVVFVFSIFGHLTRACT